MNPSAFFSLLFQLSFLTKHLINLQLSDTRNTFWILIKEKDSKNLKHLASKKLSMMNTKEEEFDKKLKYLTFKVKILKILISKFSSFFLIFLIFGVRRKIISF